MKFCQYCGSQIEEGTLICPHCNKELPSQKPREIPQNNQNDIPSKNPQSINIQSWIKKPIAWGLLAVLAVAIVFISIGSGKCDYGSCKNKGVPGYNYCYTHKCAISDCDDSCFVYSNFCYSHYLLYDDDAVSNTKYVPSYQLKISNVQVYTKGNYTYAEGTVTNNSDTTVTFLEIKGSFKTSSGSVVDTDWTYAVGSEGLAPGESCKWKLSVEKDYSIKDCDISILDYNY